MKTVKIFLYAALAASMFLSACSGTAAQTTATGGASLPAELEPVSNGEKVRLVYWSMWNEPEPQAKVIASWIKQFETAHPNITITAVWNGRENQSKALEALNAGTRIDLIDQDADLLASGLMAEDMGYALDDLVDTPALDENVPLKDVFTPGVLDLYKKNDHYYLWPYINNPVMFWYNQGIFSQAGVTPPDTWDEFLAAAQKIKGSGKTALAIEGDVTEYNMFLFTYLVERLKGPGFLMKAIEDKTGETWKDPAFTQALQMLRDLWDQGAIAAGSADSAWPAGQQSLAGGQSAMELCGSWLPALLKDTASFEWGGFKFPSVAGGAGGVDDLQTWLVAFMITRDSAHPKEAVEFLQFIMTQKAQQQMASEALVGVTRKDARWAEIIADGQAAVLNAKTILTPVDGGAAYHPDFTQDILYANFTEAFTGKISPQAFGEKMTEDSKSYWSNHQE